MLIVGTVVAIIVVNTLFGLGVFLRDRRSAENVFYAFFAFFANAWIASNFLENEPSFVGIGNLSLFLRLDFAFAIGGLLLWLLFCHTFIERGAGTTGMPRWLLWTTTSVGTILAALSFTPAIIRNVSFSDGIIHFSEGPFWILYAIMLLVFAIGGLWLLFLGHARARRAGRWLVREQIDLILGGFFVSVGNAIFINLFLQTFIPISLDISRIGLYGFVILVAATGYAMTRTSLFDLRLAIARTVSFVVLMAALALGYVAVFFVIDAVFAGNRITLPILAPLFVVTLAVTLSFQPIARAFRKATDRVFFQEHYDPERLLADLTLVMAETIDLHLLSEKVLDVLLSGMHITKGAFFFVRDHGITGVEQKNFRFFSPYPAEIEKLFHAEGPHAADRWVLADELEEGSFLRAVFARYDIAFAMPIRVEGNEVAVLVLGPRGSGERYYEQEVKALSVFAEEAGIAIQNAESYEAIRMFNIELEHMVDERTKELRATQVRELAKARDVARLKDEFVFVAAHELKAPVAAIKGFVELAGESQDALPDKVRHYMDSISRVSNNLSQLISDLLEIARSDEGALKVETTSVSPTAVVEAVVKELRPLAVQGGVDLRIGLHEGVPMISADEGKLSEVITNLVSNAIKYNRGGGFVEISFRGMPPYLAIDVRDDGYGIPAADQKKIFGKFFRSSNVSAAGRSIPGTGLGLFITRMLVERMGGAITFTSEEGKGSTFTVALPLEKAA